MMHLTCLEMVKVWMIPALLFAILEKAPTGEMLFGGREAYTADNPKDISKHIRRQMCAVFLSLKMFR